MKKEKITGIYTITNLINGKIYIGYAIDIYKRFGEHISRLKHQHHDNPYLQLSVNKYGIEHFKFEILEECTVEYLMAIEHYWATILNVHSDKYGYNILPTNPNKLASGHSKETSLKISNSKKGKAPKRINYLHSEETKNKIRMSVTQAHEKRKQLLKRKKYI